MALPQKLADGGLRFHGWEFRSNSKAHIMPDADSEGYARPTSHFVTMVTKWAFHVTAAQ